MSKTNKHRHNHLQSISYIYIQEELGPWKTCRKTKCSGTMIPVLVRYDNKGKVYQEYECCSCGKVIRDPQWKADKDKAREERRKWRKSPRQGHNRTNNRNSNASNSQRPRNR